MVAVVIVSGLSPCHHLINLSFISFGCYARRICYLVEWEREKKRIRSGKKIGRHLSGWKFLHFCIRSLSLLRKIVITVSDCRPIPLNPNFTVDFSCLLHTALRFARRPLFLRFFSSEIVESGRHWNSNQKRERKAEKAKEEKNKSTRVAVQTLPIATHLVVVVVHRVQTESLCSVQNVC